MGINSDLGLLGVVLTVISMVVFWYQPFIWIPLIYFTLSLPYHIYYMDPVRSAHSQKPAFLFIPKWNFVIFVFTLFMQVFLLGTIATIWSDIQSIGLGRLNFVYLLIWIIGGAGGLIHTFRSSETWPFTWVRSRFIYFFYGVGALFLLTTVLFFDFFFSTNIGLSVFTFNLLFLLTSVLTGLEFGYFKRAELFSNATIQSIESNAEIFGDEDE